MPIATAKCAWPASTPPLISCPPASKSTLTNLSASKPNVERTPISFDASILSTPRSSAFQLSSSTPLSKSSARSNSIQKMEKHKKGRTPGVRLFRLMLFFGFFLAADLVFPLVVSGVLKPSLSPDVVKRVGEKCSRVRDLNGKLRLLQKELASVVVGGVSNCSFADTLWEISQDGLLLNSRCTLYKSVIEEVTIWGWPLQTAGLLTNGFSFRTFTILSGRVTQWNGGQVGYLIWKANTSWVQPKWGASAVQLDPNTWVLEYQRSFIFDDTRLYSAALEFLKYRISRIVGRLKKDFWLFVSFEDNQYNGLTANNGLQIPT
ncbi:Sigma non-opioid intracellular receptor 1 [Spatholobus suberectus]|nr:Sigma non-opioid intracellular receptor 1 [Spatholobus suberectus]